MEIMQALLYIGFLFSFFLIFYKLIFPSSRVQLKNLPPSPPSIPILGHLHLLKKPLHHALHNLSEKYGSVLLLWFGWRPVLVISTPSAIEECFTKNDMIFANRPFFASTRRLEKDSLAMTPYGPHWRNLRQFATTEIFSSARLQMTSRIHTDDMELIIFSSAQPLLVDGGIDSVKILQRVMLIGGTETSITTLKAAVSFLILHPNEFNKAMDEIDSNVGQSRLMDDGYLSKLKYVHCIINETLRLGLTIQLNPLHESSTECVVEGFNVPSGTILIVNNWALHNDPRLWHNPTLFKPERFDGVEGEKVGFKLVPFGSGRKACCPGESLARRFIALALGTLIQCFDWEKGEENYEERGNGNVRKMEKETLMHVVFRPRGALMDTLVEL